MSSEIKCLQNAVMYPSGIPYGFHNINKFPGADAPDEDKSFFRRINVFNTLSYIPLVNIISAIVAIALLGKDISDFKKQNDGKFPRDMKVLIGSAIGSQILRMFFSTLMIIPDAIFSFARLSVYSKV